MPSWISSVESWISSVESESELLKRLHRRAWISLCHTLVRSSDGPDHITHLQLWRAEVRRSAADIRVTDPSLAQTNLTRPPGPDCETVSQESDYNVLKTESRDGRSAGGPNITPALVPSQTLICHTPWCFSLSDIYKHPVEMKMYYSLRGAQTEDWSCLWARSGTSRQQLH